MIPLEKAENLTEKVNRWCKGRGLRSYVAHEPVTTHPGSYHLRMYVHPDEDPFDGVTSDRVTSKYPYLTIDSWKEAPFKNLERDRRTPTSRDDNWTEQQWDGAKRVVEPPAGSRKVLEFMDRSRLFASLPRLIATASLLRKIREYIDV